MSETPDEIRLLPQICRLYVQPPSMIGWGALSVRCGGQKQRKRACGSPLLPTLGRIGKRARDRDAGRRLNFHFLRKRRDRLDGFDPRTEWKTEFAEVIFLRITKNRLVGRIVAERCLIAFKAQAPQPISNGS